VLVIIDQMGRSVREIPFEQSTVSMNVGDLPSGNYSFIVREKRKLTGSGSFIVR
jgi:hypothetical protein